jgi:hypothetical protein
VIGAVIGAAYAVVLLVVLNLAHVRAAFAGRGAGPSETDEEAARAWRQEEDRPDDRYGRGRLRSDDDRFRESDEG